MLCRSWFKHVQISLGNDNTQGRPADFMVFNGVTREWEHDVEQHGNTGHNQVFLNIGEVYHAWIMVQVRPDPHLTGLVVQCFAFSQGCYL